MWCAVRRLFCGWLPDLVSQYEWSTGDCSIERVRTARLRVHISANTERGQKRGHCVLSSVPACRLHWYALLSTGGPCILLHSILCSVLSGLRSCAVSAVGSRFYGARSDLPRVVLWSLLVKGASGSYFLCHAMWSMRWEEAALCAWCTCLGFALVGIVRDVTKQVYT